MAGPIRIAILADAAQARREIDQTSKSFGDKLGSASKKASLALAGLGAAGVGAALKAEEVASANARVGNVLSNMGMDAATDRTLAYAESLEKSLAIDGEVIKNTQAKLATFESLAKTADQAGGMFDRATVAAADLAAAGFGSAESNAAQLGKALQDPIKGLTALTKSGVTFTDAEKEKIKALTESGKLAQAQGIVMAAIEKQVGGTAAATADSSMKMRLAFENVIESVGMMLLPLLDRLAAVAQQVADVAAAHPQVFMAVAGAIGAISAAIVVANAAYKAYLIVTKAVAVASKAWAAAQWLLNAALSANPIGLILVALIALGAGLVLAYKKSETFRNIVNAAFSAIMDVVRPVIEWMKRFIPAAFQVIKTVITTYVNAYLTVIRTVFNAIRAVITTVWNAVKNVTRSTFQGVKNLVTGPLNDIVSFIRSVPGKILALGGKFAQAGASIIKKLIDGVRGTVGFVGDIAGSIWSALKGFINTNVIDRINGFLDFNISILGKSIPINAPDIPRLARGGITTGPTLAMIGDNPGGREAVIPLDRYDLSGRQIVDVLVALKDQARDHGRLLQALEGAVRANTADRRYLADEVEKDRMRGTASTRRGWNRGDNW